MLRYLLQKPIAVLMVFIGLIITGCALINEIPVSLLPNIDVPQIIIRVNDPNTPASDLNQNIIKPIRENLASMAKLKTIETYAASHKGLIFLTFEYGTKMALSYIEVNERLDRLTNSLPRNLERPQVLRINTSDIPVLRIQVIPKIKENYSEVSILSEKVLKKRIEQIEGVSLVDINGKYTQEISIIPDEELITSLRLDQNIITESLKNNNKDLGGLSVKNGHYRYFVKTDNSLTSIKNIKSIPIRTPDNRIITIQDIAKVIEAPEKQTGYHLYNGKEGLVITVQKQSQSRMNEMVPKIKLLVDHFKIDYPDIDFAITQDQTFLLDAGISNLYQDIIYGGILTILLLFMFLGNWISPTLMSISIPLSLIITFILFYIMGISFNIISLSGLSLGIGMLIDNSIVVIDNISRKKKEGLSDLNSSITGTKEVMAPVISQVLTTVAVYAPLILLSGMSGALVSDQSIALTISLGVSLLVAFILAPLLYKLLLKKKNRATREDTLLYILIAKAYHNLIHHVFKFRIRYFIIMILIMPLGFWIARMVPLSSLPKIEKKESLILINWNDPIDANENLLRTQQLLTEIKKERVETEVEGGIKQFMLNPDNNTIENTDIYIACPTEQKKLLLDKKIKKWLSTKFPKSTYSFIDAPNAFTQLFTEKMPFFEIRLKPIGKDANDLTQSKLSNILTQLPNQHFELGPGMITESDLTLTLNTDLMALYGVSKSALETTLQQLFGTLNITQIKHFGEIENIQFRSRLVETESKLNSTILNKDGIAYPLSKFISLKNSTHPKFITADQNGEYKSVYYPSSINNIEEQRSTIGKLASDNGYIAGFSGQYFEIKKHGHELLQIFILVVLLLYFILAIQYENLIVPIIVMLTIPFGITGSMFLLWITNGTIDVMAAIGFIVILGLIVDDPILKIEMIRRLEKQYVKPGSIYDPQSFEKLVHEAGDLCLKPMLMVSLTTSIAMVPVLLVGGIGNELQKPLAIVIIGGLTIGTFFTICFIPLAYWFIIIKPKNYFLSIKNKKLSNN